MPRRSTHKQGGYMPKTARERLFQRKLIQERINKVEGLLDKLPDTAERLFLNDESLPFKDLACKEQRVLAKKLQDVYTELGFKVCIKYAFTNSNFNYLEVRW